MITDQQIQELRERNEKRLKEVKESMGTKYLLHPQNTRSRLKTPIWNPILNKQTLS